MFVRQSRKARSWTILVFTVLTLFCLTQNSGMLNRLLNSDSVQTNSAAPFSDNVSALSERAADISELDGFEFKSCELSEKSMRLCIDIESPVVPLILLFVLTLICVLTRSSYLLPVSRQQSKIRRIHLWLCRFQE